ncbi:hypothetical protein HK104_004626, partial [Borealophlyctis nickersoniae]
MVRNILQHLQRPGLTRADSEADLPYAAVGASEFPPRTSSASASSLNESPTSPTTPRFPLPTVDDPTAGASSSSSSSTSPAPLRHRVSRPSLPPRLASSRSLGSLTGIASDSEEEDEGEDSDDDDEGTFDEQLQDAITELRVVHVGADGSDGRDGIHAPASTPMYGSPTSIPDLDSWVLNPIPQGQKLQCKIMRLKDGLDKLNPRYELYISNRVDEAVNPKQFILAAKKIKSSKSSHYVISTVSNFSAKSREGVAGKDPNIMGFKGPRKMTVLLPGMTRHGTRTELQPEHMKDTLLERYKSRNDRDILTLHNKAPQWNDETQSFVLNFNGRVTLASVKNFQIVHDNDLEYIIMQFGRVAEDAFTMDFSYPMSPVQAFAIALT